MGPKKHSLLRLARTIETEPEVLKIQVNEIAIIFYISFHEKKTSTDLSSNPSIAGGSLSLVFRGRTKTFIIQPRFWVSRRSHFSPRSSRSPDFRAYRLILGELQRSEPDVLAAYLAR